MVMVAMTPKPKSTSENNEQTEAPSTNAPETTEVAQEEAPSTTTPSVDSTVPASAANDIIHEDDDAPEEMTQDAARSATAGALQGERKARASVQRARKEKLRTRAKAHTRPAPPTKNTSSKAAPLPAEVLERAAAAAERAERESTTALPNSRKVIAKVQSRTTERTVGKYRVVTAKESSKRARSANGRGALELMRSALNGDDRMSAVDVVQRGARVAAKGQRKRNR